MQRPYFNIRRLSDHGRGFGLLRSQSDDWKAMLLFISINKWRSPLFLLLLLHRIPTFMWGRKFVRWHTPPCSTVRHIITADSLFSLMPSFTLSNHLLLGLPLFILPFRACFSLASPSFLRSVPLFSSQTTSTFFPVLFVWFPPLSLSLLFYHFWSCPAS